MQRLRVCICYGSFHDTNLKATLGSSFPSMGEPNSSSRQMLCPKVIASTAAPLTPSQLKWLERRHCPAGVPCRRCLPQVEPVLGHREPDHPHTLRSKERESYNVRSTKVQSFDHKPWRRTHSLTWANSLDKSLRCRGFVIGQRLQ